MSNLIISQNKSLIILFIIILIIFVWVKYFGGVEIILDVIVFFSHHIGDKLFFLIPS